MPEGEIQRLERMTEAELDKELNSHRDLAEMVRDLLVAYRLAARVANRAFALMKDETPERKDALTAALARYAPENFHDEGVLNCRSVLIRLYDLPEGLGERALREHIYREIEDVEKRAAP